MKLEDQVCSLELAKKLKDLGVKKESLYAYYGNAGIWHDTIVDMDYYKDADEDFKKHKLLPAYTVAELGEMLKANHSYLTLPQWDSFQGYWRIEGLGLDDGADTEADARGKILIYRLKNKLITL